MHPSASSGASVVSLLPVADAQRRVFALASPLPGERAPLVEAAGRWAAADVTARRDQPSQDLSAMDGWAIRFAERPGPWAIAGESAAGGGLDHALGVGEAARIFTGAPMPAGADSVLIQEEATADGTTVRMTGQGPPRIGHHIRRCGSDFTHGAVLIERGTLLTPARIALAALGGHGAIPVRRRPRIAIISTGDELVAPGADTPGSLLPSSNAPMLAASLAGTPATVADRGIVADRLDLITAALIEAAAHADIIVTSGGASVGDHDLLRPALERAGATIDFWRIAMKPGKPLMAGRLGDAVVLGLPGNPVSAYVTAELFLKPLVRHLSGATDPLPATREGVLGAPLAPTGARAEYLRARLVEGRLIEVASQDSAAVRALAAADCLVIRPPHAPAASAGETASLITL